MRPGRSTARRVAAALALLAAACEGGGRAADAAGRADAPSPRPPTQAEMIRAFQDSLPRVDSLAHAASTREALVRRLVEAAARADTAALRDLAISKAEFGHLYFPGSAVANPPYSLDPGTAWLLLVGESGEGLRELLQALGGRQAGYVSHTCDAAPKQEGAARVWRRCVVRRREGDRVVEQTLFNSLVELGGRFKVYSYGMGPGGS